MDYKYVATVKTTGERKNGVLAAESVADLVNKLKKQGMLPLRVYEAKKAAKEKITPKQKTKVYLKKPIRSKELAIFTRQLAATLGAGLLLTEALDAIAEDMENVKFANIIRVIREEIQAGKEFSVALAQYPQVFPVTYTAIVKSGEATGSLHVTMANLAKYLESSERLKEKVKSAVRYPLFVVGFAILVVLVIVLFLIPKFEGMFTNAGAELPLLTRIVVGISNFCLYNFHLFLLIIFAAGCLFTFAMRFEKFRFLMDRLKIKIPVLGKEVIHKALIARYCRTLAFLYAGGINLSKALEITAQVVNHLVMAKAINEIRDRVVAGSSLAEEMRKQPIFTRLSAKMASVGERTGKVSELLQRTC
ncbi:MAG: type II secretion system F family protein, partial [Candidatus Omnitrophica bacterium]|nr:type II secretion system F family protein [Candidatus Omnitrophota bacterium]